MLTGKISRSWIRRGVLAAAVALSCITTPTAQSACPCSIWSAATTPGPVIDDPNAVELGVKFQSDTAGVITGLRFYKYAQNAGPHVGNLWTGGGQLLASVAFTTETASGWQQATFTTPVAVAANTTYIASYFTPTGFYAGTDASLTTGVDHAPLHALADGAGGGNGVYAYSASSTFPNHTWDASNYWVDVVFMPASGVVSPAVTATRPASGATDVPVGTVVAATFNEAMTASTISTATLQLIGPGSATVSANVAYDPATLTATVTPATALAAATEYMAIVQGGSSGVRDASGNPLASSIAWTFTTAAAQATCPCSIWSGATAPGPLINDPNAVELGVKFQSDTAGFITGLRFYKYAQNTGPHVGNLWTTTGHLLATVPFVNETASGWQQAMFETPVAIAPDTTYVASYFTPTGSYAATSGGLATAVDNPPLKTLADGNGVYMYSATSTFPSQTWAAANYWVDVVFQTDTPSALIASHTATPIKHLIVLLGENRSFDHLFGTFVPNAGQTIWNLWSLGIMNSDGTPGPNFSRALQWQASDTTTYSIHPPKTTAYATLPAPSLGSPPPAPPFSSAATAETVEPALPPTAYNLLTFSGSGLPNGVSADPRFPSLANGPIDVLGYVSNDDYLGGPLHRFYQMWQQLDCDVAAATPQNPSGCQNDLFPWVEQTAGAEGAASMEIYDSAGGLSPYLQHLAQTYALSDNFHQAVLGGTGANHIELFYGSPIFYANADGTPGTPPATQIENPDPKPGTNNHYTQDGYSSGSYTNCSDLSQPGVASLRSYLAALPTHPFHGCYPGEYYLLNNFAPGYLGNGTPAPLGATQYTVPPTEQPHLGMLLDQHGVSWTYYGEGWANGAENGENGSFCNVCSGFLYSTQTMADPVERATHLKDIQDLYADIQQGTLPAVAFVKPDGYLDGHPGSSKWDLFEEFSRKIVELVQANPIAWSDTAVVVTVDEGGGYWDSGYVQPLDFFGDGPRIPLLVVSPYAQNVGVVHTYYDHVSIDKFIERNWQIGGTISPRGRDNLPNPTSDPANPYVPINSPAIGDLFELFGR